MRRSVIFFAVFVICSPVFGQNHGAPPVPPDQFEIGRRTFFDFGPPFNYYDLFVVRPTPDGTAIEKISLTPPGGSCYQPAKVEVATATINESIATILGKTNPCAIPEKELHRELKRCKKCLVFSGSNVAMEVQCGNQTRVIRLDILDRDMFDPAVNTPEHTAWTMQLLRLLDKTFGPSVMDKPIFPTGESANPPLEHPDSLVLRDLSAGKYDELFLGAAEKPSDLYRLAQNRPPLSPNVRLLSTASAPPGVLTMPTYPPVARSADMQGTVSFTIYVDATGHIIDLTFQSGAPIFQAAVKSASSSWKFPPNLTIPWIRAAIKFSLDCVPPPK